MREQRIRERCLRIYDDYLLAEAVRPDEFLDCCKRLLRAKPRLQDYKVFEECLIEIFVSPARPA